MKNWNTGIIRHNTTLSGTFQFNSIGCSEDPIELIATSLDGWNKGWSKKNLYAFMGRNVYKYIVDSKLSLSSNTELIPVQDKEKRNDILFSTSKDPNPDNSFLLQNATDDDPEKTYKMWHKSRGKLLAKCKPESAASILNDMVNTFFTVFSILVVMALLGLIVFAVLKLYGN